MKKWKAHAKIIMALIITGAISLIIFAIFGLPLLNTHNLIQIGFDDVLLAELAIFGTLIFGFWIWTKFLQFIKQKKHK